jgi:hypothetical protein
MRRAPVILLLLLLALIAISASAQQDEITTDRPDQSNSPVLVPAGALQIETGMMTERDYCQGSRAIIIPITTPETFTVLKEIAGKAPSAAGHLSRR